MVIFYLNASVVYAVVMCPSICLYVCLSLSNCHTYAGHRLKIRDKKAQIWLLLAVYYFLCYFFKH